MDKTITKSYNTTVHKTFPKAMGTDEIVDVLLFIAGFEVDTGDITDQDVINECNKVVIVRRVKKTEKKCALCKRILPLSEFYRNARNRDGYCYRCKECEKVESVRR